MSCGKGCILAGLLLLIQTAPGWGQTFLHDSYEVTVNAPLDTWQPDNRCCIWPDYLLWQLPAAPLPSLVTTSSAGYRSPGIQRYAGALRRQPVLRPGQRRPRRYRAVVHLQQHLRHRGLLFPDRRPQPELRHVQRRFDPVAAVPGRDHCAHREPGHAAVRQRPVSQRHRLSRRRSRPAVPAHASQPVRMQLPDRLPVRLSAGKPERQLQHGHPGHDHNQHLLRFLGTQNVFYGANFGLRGVLPPGATCP